MGFLFQQYNKMFLENKLISSPICNIILCCKSGIYLISYAATFGAP